MAKAAEGLLSNSTLATVPLAKPEHYVTGVMDNMRRCRKLHGNAAIRIGILGSGQTPYYRIVYEAGGEEQIFDSYWDNHRSFSEEGRATTGHHESWSTVAVSYDEVAAFRGTIPKKR